MKINELKEKILLSVGFTTRAVPVPSVWKRLKKRAYLRSDVKDVIPNVTLGMKYINQRV